MQSNGILNYDRSKVKVHGFDIANGQLQALVSIHGQQRLLSADVHDLNYWAWQTGKVVGEEGRALADGGQTLLTSPFSHPAELAGYVIDFFIHEGKLTAEMIWQDEFEQFWQDNLPGFVSEADLFLMQPAA